MREGANSDNKWYMVINTLVDAILLGMVWLLFCIPIITVGASTTAFYYTYHKCIRQRRGYLWSEFFKAFKENFKQSTLLWLIFLAAFLFIAGDIGLSLAMSSGDVFTTITTVVIFFTGVLLLLWSQILFPYTARFNSNLKAVIINSFLMSCTNFGWTLLLGCLFVSGIVLTFVATPSVLLLPAGYMWALNRICEGVFRKYMTEEEVRMEIEWDKRQ